VRFKLIKIYKIEKAIIGLIAFFGLSKFKLDKDIS